VEVTICSHVAASRRFQNKQRIHFALFGFFLRSVSTETTTMHGVLSISIFSNEAEMHNSFPVFAFSLTLKSLQMY
jgi:hypothetical protein